MNIFKEKEEETRKRVSDLAEDVDCGMMQPPMDAQVAINELTRHLLGSDYYVMNPVSAKQCNTQIVYDIERKYRRMK